jgi:hypothetical protein
MIWPAPGVTAEHLATTLGNLNGMPRPILAGANGGDEVITKYLQWVNDADRMLGPVLRRADLDRLVYTPRYWATLANPIPAPAVVGAVRQETEQRERDLDAALKEARELRDHWAADPRGTQVVVPDTGVFLNHVEEKNGRFDIGTIAWRSPGSWHLLRDRTAQVGPVAIEVLPDVRGHQRLPRNDDELVDRAVVLKEILAAPVHFLSYDTGAVLRANLAGLRGHRLQDQGSSHPAGGAP